MELDEEEELNDDEDARLRLAVSWLFMSDLGFDWVRVWGLESKSESESVSGSDVERMEEAGGLDSDADSDEDWDWDWANIVVFVYGGVKWVVIVG